MPGTGEPKSPVDHLVDLFVYAPVGFLYEREELLDKVVTRGRSQVQLARLMATMASQRGGGPEAIVNEVANQAADLLTKSIVEFGVAVGLVPKPHESRPSGASTEHGGDIIDVDIDDAPLENFTLEDSAADDTTPPAESSHDSSATSDDAGLPIAEYDTLNARTVISTLDELELDEVRRVVEYESAHRNRKTILAKAERLLS